MDIKASDLRIGNLFIGYDGLEFEWGLFHFELMNKGIEIDEIIHKGVPLTEELLLRFGFKYTESNNFTIKINEFLELELMRIGSEYCTFSVKRQNDECFAFRRISYFHELQNLFYVLTGYELKNPPVKDQEG